MTAKSLWLIKYYPPRLVSLVEAGVLLVDFGKN